MEENKFTTFLKAVGNEIKQTVLTKTYGCYVALVAWLLTFIQIITYSFVEGDLFNPGVIIASVFGVILFIVLSLFRKTSPLAPVILMVCDVCALFAFASADGIVDTFSTLFFDGVSLGKLFTLPTAEWMSIFSFVLSFIISSVAVYLPQNKKAKTEKEETESNENVEKTQSCI